MAQASGVLPFDGNSHRGEGLYMMLEGKHKIFLSHSGAQKLFVEYLCKELERCLRFPFFDRRTHSLPIGENFPKHIFDAIQQCHVGVVVLSKEFLTSKWPMMELVAMMEEARNRENFRVIPVFLQASLGDLKDAENQKQWRNCWVGLAAENTGRVKVEKCEEALKYLCSQNGVVKEGLGEFEFINKIVDAICEIVPPQIKLDDSHMEGRSRLCKVIRDQIDLQVTSKSGVCMMGLYGMGGMGKTTICKALCNELFTKFHGRVCHAELETHGEEKLLRDVLKRLSNKRQELLNGFNLSELHDGLRNGEFIETPIFLALDNMCDSNSSIMEAKRYLSAKLPNGSIIMVTSRSKESLTLLRPLINENECMKMPELEVEEARALFVKSCEGRNKDDEQLIQQCIGRCHFENDGWEASYHYHPLALSVLGRELARLDDPREWKVELDMIEKDIFNQSNERDHHPIFSILRKSYDTLSADDQLLFMDVALYLPVSKLIHSGEWRIREPEGMSNLEWLGMASKIRRLEDVKKGLERLKRKSLIESTGDKRSGTSVHMHDLWHEFCIAETNRGELKLRPWVYKRNTCSENSPCESVPEANNWGNVKRMALLDLELNSLGSVNFALFPNVEVLKIKVPQINSKEKQVIDLSSLLHLRSLEMWGNLSVTVQGLPTTLVYLSLQNGWSTAGIQGVKNLTNLQDLKIGYCSGVDALPGYETLTQLRFLTITSSAFNDVTGLSNLTALESLEIEGCENLELLDFSGCTRLNSFRCRRPLMALTSLKAKSCTTLTEVPDLGMFPGLERIELSGCTQLNRLLCGMPLMALTSLEVKSCTTLTEVPYLGIFPALERIELSGCTQLNRLSCWRRLMALTSLEVKSCTTLTEVPDLGMFPGLERIELSGCTQLNRLSCWRRLMALTPLEVKSCTTLTEVPYLGIFPALERIELSGCTQLNRLSCWRRLMALTSLEVKSCTTLTEVPDLGMFPALERIKLSGCTQLNRLLCGMPLMALTSLEVKSCTTLTEVPDLGIFPALERIELSGCTQLNRLLCGMPLMALTSLEVKSCTTLIEVPDLGIFPALERIELSGCTQLNRLLCGMPLMALTSLEVKSCTTLTEVPDLGMFPALERIDLS